MGGGGGYDSEHHLVTFQYRQHLVFMVDHRDQDYHPVLH